MMVGGICQSGPEAGGGTRGGAWALGPGQDVEIVLASASPRRRDLLGQIGLDLVVIAPDLDEAPVTNHGTLEELEAQVVALARAKAEAVLGRLAPGGRRRLVIGADTVVLVDGEVLGKPASMAEARRMLGQLSGKTHLVFTGVAVLDPGSGRLLAGAERTKVTMVPLQGEWIERYIRTGEPMDKAGGYAVQGLGSVFIERVEGCYSNVVGLPLVRLAGLLRAHGYNIEETWSQARPY